MKPQFYTGDKMPEPVNALEGLFLLADDEEEFDRLFESLGDATWDNFMHDVRLEHKGGIRAYTDRENACLRKWVNTWIDRMKEKEQKEKLEGAKTEEARRYEEFLNKRLGQIRD